VSGPCSKTKRLKSARKAVSSFENGSSSNKASGCASSVRISATRARWPPDSVAGSRGAKPANPAEASAASIC